MSGHTPRPTARALAALLSFAVLWGCGKAPPEVSAAPQPELVWPAAPLPPRIKYVTTLTGPEDLGIRQGLFDSLVDFVVGAAERRTSAPYGIAKDRDGRIYVVDTFHKAVQVFDSGRGRHYWFPDGPLEGFLNPIGIAAGPDDRVYVSDSEANVVHVFAEHGRRYEGTMGRGALTRPTGLAVNPITDELLVADTLASQIVVFDTATQQPVRFLGRQGKEEKSFNSPTNVAFSQDGRIYVTDSLNFRVQVFGPDLEFIHAFGRAGDAPGYFSRPKGLATDSDGNVYVVDALFDNVQIFDHRGRLLLAFGSPGAGPGQFWLPNEIFIDPEDRIYVSDSQNRRIQVFQYVKEGGG